MLQLLFAVAFSAAPLTLYVPPVRSLNPFLEAVEMFVREAAVYTLRAYPRVRLGLRRILASLNRALR
ncbi:RING/FYVE/PHD zinc finger superfamily protein, putative isoform 1 [Cocos nucifera]|uniref:RING/FYVE/PHD zinc finger superfamily protein, putative isoform 1 n=1 Tax=Cocos nucifera TaxID=13894 RepID=A0A8K0I865_COCNU|nr:RING/FYVE/PHD zinc finger superfamily protein, putative isoform 1 [Cocos nucifera]